MYAERVRDGNRGEYNTIALRFSSGPMSYLWTALLGARLYLDETAAATTAVYIYPPKPFVFRLINFIAYTRKTEDPFGDYWVENDRSWCWTVFMCQRIISVPPVPRPSPQTTYCLHLRPREIRSTILTRTAIHRIHVRPRLVSPWARADKILGKVRFENISRVRWLRPNKCDSTTLVFKTTRMISVFSFSQ